jgi:hypothetical protein
MQLSLSIQEALFTLLNVGVVTDEIPQLFIGNPPLDYQGECVSNNVLTNPNLYVQSGYCNVNVFVPMVSTGRFNLARFKQIVPIISDLLDDSHIRTSDGTFYFQVEDDKGIFLDEDRDGMSYYNLRLTFQSIK